jgi:hypothetical protein
MVLVRMPRRLARRVARRKNAPELSAARIHEDVKRDRGAAFMPLQRRHRTAAGKFHGFLLP